MFLCPRFRAGVCDADLRSTRGHHKLRFYALGFGLASATRGRVHHIRVRSRVSMPSVSGSALRHLDNATGAFIRQKFSMPSVSGWVCDRYYRASVEGRRGRRQVSMPSVSGWGLRCYRNIGVSRCTAHRRVSMPSVSGRALQLIEHTVLNVSLPFLCPRFRAGLCDLRSPGLHQDHPVVSMPSVSGWALRSGKREPVQPEAASVSMPSAFGLGFATTTA
jgi:hypothetical protein